MNGQSAASGSPNPAFRPMSKSSSQMNVSNLGMTLTSFGLLLAQGREGVDARRAARRHGGASWQR